MWERIIKSSYRILSVSYFYSSMGVFPLITHSFMYFLHFTDLGLRQPRLEGDEYLEIIDEFMEAAFTRWPKAVVQVYLSFYFGFTF